MSLSPVYLVDASIYIFRAWFSISDEFANTRGEPTNAVYGFTGFLCSLLEQTRAQHIGIAFDESTTPNSARLTPRVPDADRTWLTLGFTYKPSNSNMNFDFGYAHLFVDDAKVNQSPADAENLLRGALIGEYELDVNILSAQARWAF